MRKITRDSVDAFLNDREFRRANMSVTRDLPETTLRLHGHIIARRVPVAGGFGVEDTVQVRVYDAGYQTVTTKERLNGVLSLLTGGLYRVYQKDFTWFLYSLSEDRSYPWTGGAVFNEHGAYLHAIDA